MTSAPALLVLTGPAGAGKTTVAHRLAETWGGRAVHLHTDDFFGAIKSGFIAPWLPEAAPQNQTVTRVILAAAGAYAQDGFQVIVDGIVGPFRLPVYQAEAARLGVAIDYAVLRPARQTAIARARDRAETPLPDYPPSLYDMFVGLGPLESHVVESEGETPDALAAAVRAGMAGGRFRIA